IVKRSPWKLSPLFSPHSIAVIGASPKGGAGSIVIRNLQRLGFAGTIHPVNPKYADVLGYPCHPSLETIPGPVDCAAVLLGDKAILPILKTAHARGVKGVWAFASGFAETGERERPCSGKSVIFAGKRACSSAAPTASATPTSRTGRHVQRSPPPRLPQGQHRRHRPKRRGAAGPRQLAPGSRVSRLISSGNEAALGLADYGLPCG
ncbi:MAG: CoA-binding protein, partial [Bilophila wadsworthia]